jgi:hypothetical protein
VRSRTNSASARPDPLDRRTPAPPRPSRTGEPFATSRSPLPPPPRTAPSHCARASDVAHRTFIFLFHLAGPAAPSSHPPPLCHTHTHTHTHRERHPPVPPPPSLYRHHHRLHHRLHYRRHRHRRRQRRRQRRRFYALAPTLSTLRSRPYISPLHLALTSRPAQMSFKFLTPLRTCSLKNAYLIRKVFWLRSADAALTLSPFFLSFLFFFFKTTR